MDTEVIEKTKEEKEKVKKHKMLLDAHNNNIEISDKNLGDKFEDFEKSKLEESKTLLYEVNSKPKRYQRYFRGEIVRVKFGVNVGSEFSGDHFAIVISKNDSVIERCLHVIPLTSKKGDKRILIDNILYNEEELDKLRVLLNNDDISKDDKKMIKDIIRYYSIKKNIVSYANYQHMKTVSKLSVSKSMFPKYDYLPFLICPLEIMEELDKKII